MKYIVLVLAVLVALLIAAGCTTTPPANATVTPTGTTIAPNATTVQPGVYTLNDSGKTVPLGLQQTLSIRLPENPTTGYSWNASVSTGLVIVDTAYTAEPAATGIVGAGGTRNWTVRAVQAGAQQFSAVYIRPWEPNLSAGEFNLTIEVS
jgi:inhibitor of cysteine peptidase